MPLKRVLTALFIVFAAVSGLVAVTLAQTPTPLPVFPITPGRSVEGNISSAITSARYSFEAKAGDTVTMRMAATSGDLDPFLLLFAPNGDLMADNDDDGSGNRDAVISVTVTDAGTYTVEATRFQGEEGQTAGTYRLSLDIAGTTPTDSPVDPLTLPPSFGVPFTYINYDESQASLLPDIGAKRYFAVGGRQGDLVRVIMTTTGGDLSPQVSILNNKLTAISREARATSGEMIVYTTLPETGWYLIEAAARSGSGSFALYVNRRAVAVVQIGDTLTGDFTPETPSISYIFNAHIGDQVFANLDVVDADSGIVPEVKLLDLSLQSLGTNRAVTPQSSRLRALIPRSGPYILQVNNVRPNVSGQFSLRLSGFPVNIAKLPVEAASYNDLYKGTLNDEKPITYYRFAGKAGELVTIEMKDSGGTLDPYLILANAALDELASNDNAGNTRNARIAQFALPQDGDYFILATRTDLAAGRTSGAYDLSLTVGQISLLPGGMTVTLEWDTDADLNLFVRDPDGRTVSWSRPRIASGGRLQIDSNTRCQTPSAQPVEHIYWPPGAALPDGEYEIWVWYQNVCTRSEPTAFSLVLAINGETELEIKPGDVVLQPDQRFEASIRHTAAGAVLVNRGQVTTPSAQQRASQGGDTLILYDQSLTGTITDDVYTLFYQFEGKANDKILLTVETLTGNLDPIVVLRDDADNNLGINDDADNPTTYNARLAYTLPASGQYVIAVTRYGMRDGTTTGDFRLTLKRGE